MQLMSLKEAAKALRVHENTVSRLITEGRIKFIQNKPRAPYWFTQQMLDDYLKSITQVNKKKPKVLRVDPRMVA